MKGGEAPSDFPDYVPRLSVNNLYLSHLDLKILLQLISLPALLIRKITDLEISSAV